MGVYPGRKAKSAKIGEGFLSFLPQQLRPSSEQDRPWRLFKRIVKDGQSLTALQVLNEETIEVSQIMRWRPLSSQLTWLTKAHLHLMFNFSNLLDSLERCARRHRKKLLAKGDPIPDFLAKGWIVTEFLSYAERRYKLWMDAMGSAPSLAAQCPPW
jgi:hypothetical protein